MFLTYMYNNNDVYFAIQSQLFMVNGAIYS